MTRDRIVRRLAPWVLGVGLLACWYGWVTLTAPSPVILPGPDAVWAAFVTQLTTPTFWPFFTQTVLESLGGCLLGALVGLPLGIVIHRWSWFNAAVSPFLGASQAIPAIALAPVLVLWVGYGMSAVLFLCALMVFFPIVVATVVGLRSTDPEVVDAARLDGAGSWAILSHLELPDARPMILAGVRNGFALSVTGAVVGEMVMGGSGLGMLLTVQRDSVNTAGMFATILVLALMASTLFGLITHLERKLS